MALFYSNILRISIFIAVAGLCGFTAGAAPVHTANAPLQVKDTIPGSKGDTLTLQDSLKYPISDRRVDKISNDAGKGFDLNDPPNIKDSIIYDPKEKKYYIIEKIGDKYYRKPTELTFEEFNRIQARKQEQEYFRQRANTISLMNRSLLKPDLKATDDLFNRLFGNGKVDIRPQGTVGITAGYQGQNVKNPTLPERARKNGGFDFDMAANLNVIANIGFLSKRQPGRSGLVGGRAGAAGSHDQPGGARPARRPHPADGGSAGPPGAHHLPLH